MTNNAPIKKETNNPWETSLPDGTPITAKFYNDMRSSAFKNVGLGGNIIELVKMVRVSEHSDSWIVTKYTFNNIDDREKGIFLSEALIKDAQNKPQPVCFMDALGALGQFQLFGEQQPYLQDAEIEKNYPATHPAFKMFYFDVEHFETAAHVESVVFDENKVPHRRVSGSIVDDAAIPAAELMDALTAAEKADPALKGRIEGGILSDMFNQVSGKEAGFDIFMKVMDSLTITDRFAAQIGGFYLGLYQLVNNMAGSFDQIDGFETEEKRKSAEKEAKRYGKGTDFDGLRSILLQAQQTIEKVSANGTYAEPFQKFVMEADIYLYMLEAKMKKDQLMRGAQSGNGVDGSLIVAINTGVSAAIDQFKALGGPQNRIDELKGWVMNENVDRIPGFVPGFLNRYHAKSAEIMRKIEKRDVSAGQDMKVMAATVKPGLAQQDAAAKKNAPGKK